MAFPVPVGHKFLPNDKQLVGYYLFNKLFTQPPPFSDHEKSLIKDFDLYGSLEPWEIWQLHGGDDLENDQALYFFTPLKRVSVNGSRICRRVGSGTWAGEDSGDKIKAGNIVALKKRFRYENRHSPHDGAWIMHEFAVHSALLGQQQKPYDIVLCRLKENPRASHNKRKLKDGSFEPSKRCKFTVPIPAQTLSHTGLMVQASEPEPEDPNLMFDPQELLSTLEVPLQLSSTVKPETLDKAKAGESYNMVDVQDNILQHPMTTTQAEDMMTSTPHDSGVGDDMMRDRPLMRDTEDMMPTTDAGDSENAVDAHHNMFQPPITTTSAESDYNLVAEDGMPLSTALSSSPCNVEGDDCSWENMMKDIPLPNLDDIIDIHSSDATDFWDFEFFQLQS